jgi:hypothetical protein
MDKIFQLKDIGVNGLNTFLSYDGLEKDYNKDKLINDINNSPLIFVEYYPNVKV